MLLASTSPILLDRIAQIVCQFELKNLKKIGSSFVRVKLDHTFVVCAYGDSPYLSDCLASLQLQTEKTNVIIATSTPSQYIDTIARAADIQVCVNDESGGIASDWNYALSCADTRLADDRTSG